MDIHDSDIFQRHRLATPETLRRLRKWRRVQIIFGILTALGFVLSLALLIVSVYRFEVHDKDPEFLNSVMMGTAFGTVGLVLITSAAVGEKDKLKGPIEISVKRLAEKLDVSVEGLCSMEIRELEERAAGKFVESHKTAIEIEKNSACLKEALEDISFSPTFRANILQVVAEDVAEHWREWREFNELIWQFQLLEREIIYTNQ